MTALKYTLAIGLTAALAAGCASTPMNNSDLDAARSQVQQAAADPLAREAAALRLQKAGAALRTAEESHQRRKPVDQVNHESYIAGGHAKIALEQIAELQARREVEQGQAERNRVLLEARTSEAALAQAAAARSDSQAEQAKSDAERQAADASAAREQLADSQTQLANAANESARLRSALEGLEAKSTARGMVLTLGDVLFDSGQASIKPGAQLKLDRLAEVMRGEPALSVMIEGHTDSLGDEQYNLSLSQRRADAVSALLSARGVDGQRVRSSGLGEDYPTASNNSSAGRQQNRRVEIIFSDGTGHFSPGTQRLSVR
jgi:outer membrane protein OmpA-like peptidoglycan-associated protein